MLSFSYFRGFCLLSVVCFPAFCISEADLREINANRWTAEIMGRVLDERLPPVPAGRRTEDQVKARAAAEQALSARYVAAFEVMNGRNELFDKERLVLAKKFAPLVATEPALRTAVTAHFVKDVKETNTKRLEIGVSEYGFTFAKALFESGALKGVPAVKYGDTPPLLLQDNTQLEWSTFPNWILEKKAVPLFESAMALRENMSVTSSPTRDAFTNEILKRIETDYPPEEASKLRDAVKKHMVKVTKGFGDQDKPVPGAGNKGDPRYAMMQRTLSMRLGDGSDLKLGKMLFDTGNLQGVERVAYPGLVDRRVERGVMWETTNYPAEIVLHDKKGARIGDVLDPANYVKSQSSTYGSKGLWRNEMLRSASYRGGPSTAPVGCDLKSIVPGAAAGVRSSGR